MKSQEQYTEDGFPAVGQFVYCETMSETVTGPVTRATDTYFYVDDCDEIIRVNPETVDWQIISREEFEAGE